MEGCTWPGEDTLMQAYHDNEWGRPLYDDKQIFEAIILDTFQAGLSWRTVLHKREHFKNAFADFDVHQVASFSDQQYDLLIEDKGIIRNKLKIKAAITNAQAFIKIQKTYGSFHQYIWQFTNNAPTINQWTRTDQVPVSTPASDAMSKDLKKHGFKFVGTTICYAFMQAIGMVNDHVVSCPCWQSCQND